MSEQPYTREHATETSDVIVRPDGSTMKRHDPSKDSTAVAPEQVPESAVGDDTPIADAVAADEATPVAEGEPAA